MNIGFGWAGISQHVRLRKTKKVVGDWGKELLLAYTGTINLKDREQTRNGKSGCCGQLGGGGHLLSLCRRSKRQQ